MSRVAQRFPRTSISVADGGPKWHVTTARFRPPNRRGAAIDLVAAYDWSFDLDVGRFKVCEMEQFSGSEADHIELVTGKILAIAHHGFRRGWMDRLISFGRDRVEPWEL